MSSYYADAINPKTGKSERALFADNYYGSYQYAVIFDDGGTYRAKEVKIVEPEKEPAQ